MKPVPTEETEVVTTVSKEQPQQVVHTMKRVVEPTVLTEHPQKAFEKKKTIFRFYQIIWYILTVLEIFLAFRMFFKAIGANPFSGFVTFIYAVTDPLVIPFLGILRTTVTGPNVIEWSTLIAAAVYALLAFGLVELFQFVKPVSQEEVETSVDEV